MALPMLTSMRRSVWSAIDAWPAFDGTFARKFKLEGRGQLQPKDFVPALADLNCILIEPQAVATPWVNNQDQRAMYTLGVTVWSSWRSVLQGEWIWQEFQKAIWQQGPPGGGGTFIEHEDYGATNIHSVSLPGVPSIHDVDGEPIMFKWVWSLTLQRTWNPRTETGELELPEAN